MNIQMSTGQVFFLSWRSARMVLERWASAPSTTLRARELLSVYG